MKKIRNIGIVLVIIFAGIFILDYSLSSLEYEKVAIFDEDEKTLIIYPTFTQSAYDENGFYSYYEGTCDETCLTVKINHQFNEAAGHSASFNGFITLKSLGYAWLSDTDVDKNPDVLNHYDKIILLHNEYVTLKEFNAIVNHPKVVYLYPNSLHAEVEANYDDDTITLVWGHGYPNPVVFNGFGWEFDNTDLYEQDVECENWEFYEIDNGYMLNCYPERIIHFDRDLLIAIKKL